MVTRMYAQVVDVDPATGEIEGDTEGFPEEYPLEEVEVSYYNHSSHASLVLLMLLVIRALRGHFIVRGYSL